MISSPDVLGLCACLGASVLTACGSNAANLQGSGADMLDKLDATGDWGDGCANDPDADWVDGPPGMDIVEVRVEGTGGTTVVTIKFAGDNQALESTVVDPGETSWVSTGIQLESGTYIDARLIEGGAKVSDGLAGVEREWPTGDTLVFTFDGFSTSAIETMRVDTGRYDFANGDWCDTVMLENA